VIKETARNKTRSHQQVISENRQTSRKIARARIEETVDAAARTGLAAAVALLQETRAVQTLLQHLVRHLTPAGKSRVTPIHPASPAVEIAPHQIKAPLAQTQASPHASSSTRNIRKKIFEEEDKTEGRVAMKTPEVKRTEPEGWETPQKILVILAHPDDPEFFCGATIARWCDSGHTVHYCLLTRGDKGGKAGTDPLELAAIREVEQNGAAKRLGVQKVTFLSYYDGLLIPDLETRLAVTRIIRQEKPDIIVSCDPTQIFGENSINHPDHRAVGQTVVDAVFPAAGNALYYPEMMADESLEPHSPNEVWLTVTGQPNTILDVTDYWETKIDALRCHASQIGDFDAMADRMRKRNTPDSTPENPRFEERFRRFKFR
jgi:LmbE family N-acetylglucosaminyl deacetylase